jgi:hypothetical protein
VIAVLLASSIIALAIYYELSTAVPTPLQSPQSTPSPTSTVSSSVQPKNGKPGSLTADYLILAVAVAVLVLVVIVIISTLRRSNVWAPLF